MKTAHQSDFLPFEKGSVIKEKKLLPVEANFYFERRPFLRMGLTCSMWIFFFFFLLFQQSHASKTTDDVVSPAVKLRTKMRRLPRCASEAAIDLHFKQDERK